MSRLLGNLRIGGGRATVEDVKCLSNAEILVTDEVYGRESRGGCWAFETTKGISRSRASLAMMRTAAEVASVRPSESGQCLERGLTSKRLATSRK